jgi:uncharacterized protein (TIGR03067 family)
MAVSLACLGSAGCWPADPDATAKHPATPTSPSATKSHRSEEPPRPTTREPAAVETQTPAVPEGKPDPDLDGQWKLVKVYDRYGSDGKSYLAVTSKYHQMVRGSAMTIVTESGGKTTELKYTLVLDQTRNPKVYKRTSRDANQKTRTESGIYAVQKDTLLLSSQADGTPPEGFSVQKNDAKNRRIYEFQRIRP